MLAREALLLTHTMHSLQNLESRSRQWLQFTHIWAALGKREPEWEHQRKRRLRAGWESLINAVLTQELTSRMEQDRIKWTLHALSSASCDLQAWYHCVFYKELYRVRGAFWHHGSHLVQYGNSYDITSGGDLTALESNVLKHAKVDRHTSFCDVLCHQYTAEVILLCRLTVSPCQVA